MSTNQYQEAWIASAAGRSVDPDTDNSYDCVDVPKDYAEHIWANTNWRQVWPGAGNAKDMLYTYSTDYFDRILNDPNDPNLIPQRGDVVIFGGASINPYGHIAVVLDADTNGMDVLQADSYLQCPMYVGHLAYTNAGTGPCTGWLRPKFDDTEVTVASSTTTPISSSQRVVGQYGVKERDAASTSGNVLRTFNPGDTLDFKGFVHGENASGTDVWFVGAYAGNYFSASAFDDGSTNGLKDLTPAPTPAAALQPYQRVVGVDTANYRDAPRTSGNSIQTFHKGDTLNFKGYVHGESVNGTDVWFVGAYTPGYISASVFDNSSTNGLKDITPAPAPAPAPSTTRSVGGSAVNVRDNPFLSGNVVGQLAANSSVTVKGYCNGDSVNGNSVWYSIDKGWIWSGGVDSQSTAGVPAVAAPSKPQAPQYNGLDAIDISDHQKGIDLTKVPGKVVIIKASEGVDWADPSLAANVASARAAGKIVGFYHFARPLAQSGNTAQAEAESFVKFVTPLIQKGDFLALDWEAENIGNVAWAKEWLDRVYTAFGVRPLFYSYLNALSTFDWSSVSAYYPLWLAQYPTTAQQGYGPVAAHAVIPGTWKLYIWQYSSKGLLTGWTGDLDLDIVLVTEAELAAIGYNPVSTPTPAPAPAPAPAPEPTPSPAPEPAPAPVDPTKDKNVIAKILGEFFQWITDLFIKSR